MKKFSQSVQALSAFSKIKHLEDAVLWHKSYTPWFTEDQCVILAKSYWKDAEQNKLHEDDKSEEINFKQLSGTQFPKKIKKSKRRKPQENKENGNDQVKESPEEIKLQPAKLLTEMEKLYIKSI